MEFDPKTRIVITGRGAIGPLGLTAQENIDNRLAGISGLDYSYRRKPDGSPIHSDMNIVAEVKEFKPDDYFKPRDQRRMHISSQFAVIAFNEAVRDAGFIKDDQLVEIDPERFGVRIGTGVGGTPYAADVHEKIGRVGDSGRSAIKEMMTSILVVLPERGSVEAAKRNGLQGETGTTTFACASSLAAIIDGIRAIKDGDVDAMAAGGTESAIDPQGITMFNLLSALSKWRENAQGASRPFDVLGSGFVMGEGAGVVVIERLEHALARKAVIHAEIVGYAITRDTGDSDTSPDEDGYGAQRAMRRACERGGVSLDDIQFINAHGTSTPTGDRAELTALHSLFGDRIFNVPIVSDKGAVGHLLGASGGLEIVMSTAYLAEQKIPANLNLTEPIRKGFRLPTQTMEHRFNLMLKNSFGFGGLNASMVLRRWAS